jgi:DNA-binding LacI/PurR family transcriptional regulator
VWSDDEQAVRAALAHLAALGHRSVARISGPGGLWHTRIRSAAFEEATREFGMRLTTVEADYTGEQAAAATREVLLGDPRPTAVLYDNDVMAVSGLSAARDMGLAVPADISMVAWDDSPLCELVQPGLTALSRDIVDYGAQAARQLRDLVAGRTIDHLQVTAPKLVERGSTGPVASLST